MPRLLVCPLSGLDDALESHRPSHLVTLLSPQNMIPTPSGFDPARHLRLGIDDVGDPQAANNPPGRADVDRLLVFARSWDGQAPFLIHCWAGVSRSMASAFTVLCDRRGLGHEIEIALAMRRRAPHASPNRLLVQHADDALGRGGRMMTALAVMGQPLLVTEGVTTAFPLANL